MKGVSIEDFEGRMSLELRLQVGRRKRMQLGNEDIGKGRILQVEETE